MKDRYSRVQKVLRKGGMEVEGDSGKQAEGEGGGMRVKRRGKIGGRRRFPFIIPATCGTTGARIARVTLIHK